MPDVQVDSSWRWTAWLAVLLSMTVLSGSLSRGQLPGELPVPGEQALPGEEQVVEVRILGNRTIPKAKILRHIRTRVGRVFDLETIEQDVRRLNGTRMFVNVKTFSQRVPAAEGSAPGRIVIFEILERPTLQYVKYVGNEKVKKKILRKESELKEGDAADPFAVEEGRRHIEDFYHSKGFGKARVEVVEGNKTGDKGVVFLINEGSKQKHFWTQFIGNTIATDSRLRTQIKSKPGFGWFMGGDVDRRQIDEDVDRLTTYYRGLGFFRARVGRELEFNAAQKWLTLTFVIDEGPRYVVRNVAFIGNTKFPTETLGDDLKLDKDQYFDQAKMTADIVAIQEKYGSVGYIFTDVKADPRFLEEPGQLDLVYKVEEGDRYRVGRINVKIDGENPHTRITTVLNRISLQPGDIVDIRELRASERRLRASGLFKVAPAQGIQPKIVFSPPELEEEEEETQIARPPRRPGNYRGQSPDPSGEKTINVTLQGQWSAEPQPPAAGEPGAPALIRGQYTAGTAFPAFNRTVPRPQTLPPQPSSDHQTSPWAAPPNNPVPPRYPAAVAQPNTVSQPNVASQPNTVPQPNAWSQPSAAPRYSSVPRPATSGPPASQWQGASGSSNGPAYQQQAQPASGYRQPTQPAPAYRSAGSHQQPNQRAPAYVASQPNPNYRQPSAYQRTQPAPAQPPVGGAVPAQPAPAFGQPQVFPTAPDSSGADAFPDPAPRVPGSIEDRLWDEPTRDIDLETVTQETETGRLMFGVGVNSEAGVVGSVVLDEQNFDWRRLPRSWEEIRNGTAWRGGGQRLRIEAVPGTQVQRYMASIQEPYLLDTAINLGLSGFYYDRIYRHWSENRLGGRVALGYQFTHDLTGTLAFRGMKVDVYNPTEFTTPVTALQDVLGDNALYGFQARLTHDTRDNAFLATEGHLIEVAVEHVVGTFEYPRVDLDLRQYFLIRERPDGSGRHVLSVNGKLGVTGSDTPLYDHYFAGGFSTMRGFYFRGVGPTDPAKEMIVGGQFMMLASAEYMFPITADDMLRGVVFCDSGTVEEDINHWGGVYRAAAGFGLRVTVPAMGPAPIALDFAFPLSKAGTDRERLFSFFVGFGR